VESLGALATNLSPIGLSSLIAMPAAAVSAGNAQLRGRMEQRRYDINLSTEEHPWQIYAIGTSSIVRNDGGSEDAPYNFNTQGGIVGADVTISDSSLFGLALEYTNGSATLDRGAGKNKIDAVRGTAYFSQVLDRNGWFNLDAGASYGHSSYDTKRQNLLGANTGDSDGWNAGAFVNFGSVLRPRENLNILPFVGLEYNHYEVSGFTENGGDAGFTNLKVDDFSLDSLRAKFGSSFHLVWSDYSTHWRFGLEVAYAHELLDTESEITSRFALDPFGVTQNKIKSKTLPADVIQVSPSITWGLSEQTSIFASYRWEMSFEGETQHNVNVGFRYRF
jgi:outer membrane autotransporter protein